MAIFSPLLAEQLSAAEIKRFSKRVEQGSLFLDYFIKPYAYQPDKGFHLYVSPNNKTARRNHEVAQMVTEGLEAWSNQTYFTNALAIDHTDTLAAKDRTALAPVAYFTFECDVSEIGFFKRQLGWFAYNKKPSDSLFGKFDSLLAKSFKDYAGSCAVWSGSKSFHFHFAFHTDALNSIEITSLRDGYSQTWDTLCALFIDHFGLTGLDPKSQPDRALRIPDQLRRIPCGTRHTNPSKLLGLDKTTALAPQICMMEFIRQRSTGTQTVFNLTDFTQSREFVKAKQRNSSRPAASIINSTPELMFCAAKMDAIFTDYPKFAHFGAASDGLRAYFYNDPADQNPASYISEAFATVRIQGNQDEAYGRGPALPAALCDCIANWLAEFHILTHKTSDGSKRNTLEQEFADKARDKASAADEISKVMTALLANDKDMNMLVAPEGVSKSRSLFKNMPDYFADYHMEKAMVAFSTYDLAKQKCEEFNQTQAAIGSVIKGIVVRSFSHFYEIAREQQGEEEITVEKSVKAHDRSLAETIQKQQPKVYEMVEAIYRGLAIECAGPVVMFTVHAVAQDWHKVTTTRQMLSPAYFNKSLSDDQRRNAFIKDTHIDLLVHDEIGVDDLTILAPAKHLAWVKEMAETKNPLHPKKRLWTTSATTNDRYQSYHSYASAFPAHDGLDFERACELFDAKRFETVTLTNSGAYGSDTIEGSAFDHEGKEWVVHIKEWPTKQRTLVLTTEALPAEIAKKVRYDRSNGWDKEWMVTELETPRIARSRLDVRPHRLITTTGAANKIRDLIQVQPDLIAIGNKLTDIKGSITHHSAKGSNLFIGKNIVQTLTCLPTIAVEKLEAINAWLKITDAVRMFHIDQMNQTAGRNLGFRAPTNGHQPDHIVLANPRVWQAICSVLRLSRYDVAVTMPRN